MTEEQEQYLNHFVEDIKKRYSNVRKHPFFPEFSKKVQKQYLIMESRINYYLEKLKWDYDISDELK